MAVACGYRQHASIWHGVARVVDDVDQAGSKLGGIDIGRPKLRLKIELDFQVGSEGASQELADALDKLVEIGALRLQCLAAGEGKQPPREIGAAQGGIESFTGKLIQIRV